MLYAKCSGNFLPAATFNVELLIDTKLYYFSELFLKIAFSSSTTTSGTRERSATISHCFPLKTAVLKITDNGLITITATCRKIQIMAAKISLEFEKKPTLKID